MSKLLVAPISKVWVEDRIIDYFAARFNTQPENFEESTNVRKGAGFSDEAWAELSSTFNKFDWMISIGAYVSFQAMIRCNTIGDLTNAIWKSVPKLAAVKAPPASLSPFVFKLDVGSATKVTSKRAPNKAKGTKKRPVPAAPSSSGA